VQPGPGLFISPIQQNRYASVFTFQLLIIDYSRRVEAYTKYHLITRNS